MLAWHLDHGPHGADQLCRSANARTRLGQPNARTVSGTDAKGGGTGANAQPDPDPERQAASKQAGGRDGRRTGT